MSGKGSGVRPSFVSGEHYRSEHERIFAKRMIHLPSPIPREHYHAIAATTDGKPCVGEPCTCLYGFAGESLARD